MQAQLLYRCTDGTGEGAYWHQHSESIMWVDIDRGILHIYSLRTGTVFDYSFPDKISTIIPLKRNEDEILLAMKDKIISFHLKSKISATITELSSIEKNFRTNDGKASPEGRIWQGVMHMENQNNNGSLYCIDHDLSCREVLNGQSIPNGISWDHTGNTMYYVDSGKGCIYAFDYNKENGNLSSQRIVIQVPSQYGIPDGMTIDADGNLWVAHWGGFGVYIWDPRTGKLLDKIEVPAPNVASCTFGGKENNKLFITTALSGMSEEDKKQYPLSGSLFVADISVAPGVNHYPFVIK